MSRYLALWGVLFTLAVGCTDASKTEVAKDGKNDPSAKSTSADSKTTSSASKTDKSTPAGASSTKSANASATDSSASSAKTNSTDPPKNGAAKAEPAKTEPTKTEPAKTGPATSEPATTEPAKTEPAKSEPTTTDSAETPKTTETEPAKIEPAKTADQHLADAQAALERRDIDGILAALRKAVEVDPKHRDGMLALARFLDMRGVELASGPKPDQGYEMFLESGKHVHEAIKLFPDLNPPEKQVVAQSLYNEACALAKAGKSADALASLKEATEFGFLDLNQIQNDEDLESIRGVEGFAAIADAVKVKVEEEAEKERKRVQERIVVIKDEVEKEVDDFTGFPFDFTLNDLNDKPVSSADFKDKVLIVDIWGTWCPPCRREIPHFVELLKNHQAEGLEIVGINYENEAPDEAKKTIQKFVDENKMTYTCLIGDEATQAKVPEFGAFPTTLFIDRTGKVRMKLVGYTELAKLEVIAAKLLSENSVDSAATATDAPAATEAPAAAAAPAAADAPAAKESSAPAASEPTAEPK